MKKFEITKEFMDMRIDRYAGQILKNVSKGSIQKLLRKKNIKVNNKKIEGNYRLNLGDNVSFYLSDEYFIDSKSVKSNMKTDFSKLNIIYENENVIFINKPSGVLSQPDGSDKDDLVNMLGQYLNGEKYGIVNRLDLNTSGIVVAGKNRRSLMLLNELASNKDMFIKSYIVLVKGEFKCTDNNIFTNYAKKDKKNNILLVSDEQKEGYLNIITKYVPLKCIGGYTMLLAQLITGRSHQIRSQLNHMGFSVIGDIKYDEYNKDKALENKTNLKRQFLHAFEVKIKINEISEELFKEKINKHNLSSYIKINAALPHDLKNVLNHLGIKDMDFFNKSEC